MLFQPQEAFQGFSAFAGEFPVPRGNLGVVAVGPVHGDNPPLLIFREQSQSLGFAAVLVGDGHIVSLSGLVSEALNQPTHNVCDTLSTGISKAGAFAPRRG